MSRYFILGTLVVLGSVRVAAAQIDVTATSRPPLTLRAAEDEALASNPELAALRQQFEAARAAPARERYLVPPMLEAQIWGWPLTTLNPARTDMYMFTGEQELPGRGKRAARVLVGERESDIERQRVLVRANEILDEVRKTYTDVAVGRRTLSLFDQQAVVLRDIADAATLRYTVGEAGQHHTVTSVVELSRLEDERIMWQGRVREAEARLNALLGRPVDAPVALRTSPARRSVPSEARRLAIERHPELAVLRAEIAREEAELARLRGERRPDFVVGGGYMLQPGEAGAWTAKAGLFWPHAPWSRGRINAEVETQLRRLEAARARLAAGTTAVSLQVQESIVRLETALQRAQVIEDTVIPHTEHALDVARVAYSSNRGEFRELLDTQRVLVTARMEAIAAGADAERAASELERAIGLSPESRTVVEERR